MGTGTRRQHRPSPSILSAVGVQVLAWLAGFLWPTISPIYLSILHPLGRLVWSRVSYLSRRHTLNTIAAAAREFRLRVSRVTVLQCRLRQCHFNSRNYSNETQTCVHSHRIVGGHCDYCHFDRSA